MIETLIHAIQAKIFNTAKKSIINKSKISKIKKFGGKYSPAKFANFVYICVRHVKTNQMR